MKQPLSTKSKVGIALLIILCIPFLFGSLPWALIMLVHVPYEGAKVLGLAAELGAQSADYLGAAQVAFNGLAIVVGLFFGMRQKEVLVLPRGSKGLLIYGAVSVPVLLYALELYASRSDNPFLTVNGIWSLLFQAFNVSFPLVLLFGVFATIAAELYGTPRVGDAANDA